MPGGEDEPDAEAFRPPEPAPPPVVPKFHRYTAHSYGDQGGNPNEPFRGTPARHWGGDLNAMPHRSPPGPGGSPFNPWQPPGTSI